MLFLSDQRSSDVSGHTSDLHTVGAKNKAVSILKENTEPSLPPSLRGICDQDILQRQPRSALWVLTVSVLYPFLHDDVCNCRGSSSKDNNKEFIVFDRIEQMKSRS